MKLRIQYITGGSSFELATSSVPIPIRQPDTYQRDSQLDDSMTPSTPGTLSRSRGLSVSTTSIKENNLTVEIKKDRDNLRNKKVYLNFDIKTLEYYTVKAESKTGSTAKIIPLYNSNHQRPDNVLKLFRYQHLYKRELANHEFLYPYLKLQYPELVNRFCFKLAHGYFNDSDNEEIRQRVFDRENKSSFKDGYFLLLPFYRPLDSTEILDSAEIIRHLNDVVSIISILREEMLFHGDLKYSNLLISDENQIVYSDLGSLCFFDSKTEVLQSPYIATFESSFNLSVVKTLKPTHDYLGFIDVLFNLVTNKEFSIRIFLEKYFHDTILNIEPSDPLYYHIAMLSFTYQFCVNANNKERYLKILEYIPIELRDTDQGIELEYMRFGESAGYYFDSLNPSTDYPGLKTRFKSDLMESLVLPVNTDKIIEMMKKLIDLDPLERGDIDRVWEIYRRTIFS